MTINFPVLLEDWQEYVAAFDEKLDFISNPQPYVAIFKLENNELWVIGRNPGQQVARQTIHADVPHERFVKLIWESLPGRVHGKDPHNIPISYVRNSQVYYSYITLATFKFPPKFAIDPSPREGGVIHNPPY